jgi:signal transduction histidine kinase
MTGPVRRKWRPPLALVIGGTLAGVLVLPVLGIAWFRLAGNILGWLETAQLFAAVAVVATAVLALLLWRLVLRPVWALTAHARAMKAGRTDVVPPRRFGTAELGELGRSVIDMGDALHSRARSLSAYADHVTHELKSPLTVLRGATEMLRDPDLAAEDRARLLETIETASARMERLLNDLRSHTAARHASAPDQTTLAAALALVATEIEVVIARDAVLPMGQDDLARVLTQLVRNAAEHGATRVVLTGSPEAVRIADDGAGVDPGDAARVFDPFFTTKRDAGGTGMGLSIVRTLVEAAGGRISLENSADGAIFDIRF